MKTPAIPVCEPMTSMRCAIVSKSGPDVSERTYFRPARNAWNVTGSQNSTVAYGFSSRFRFVLLKNWQEIARCAGST